MRFHEFGDNHNPHIILIHGGGNSWWNYLRQARLLSDKYHVILPVLDGHGEEFQKEYGGWPVILRVTLGREPDEHILALLSKCPAWAADYGVKLEFEIGGKQVRIVES